MIRSAVTFLDDLVGKAVIELADPNGERMGLADAKLSRALVKSIPLTDDVIDTAADLRRVADLRTSDGAQSI
jgi:hypothetical protein